MSAYGAYIPMGQGRWGEADKQQIGKTYWTADGNKCLGENSVAGEDE